MIKKLQNTHQLTCPVFTFYNKLITVNFTNYLLFVDRSDSARVCREGFVLFPASQKMCVKINGALQRSSVFAKWYAVKTLLKQADKKG